MKILPYQYAPYLNINNNPKNERNTSFLVTTCTQDNKVSKITVNTKSSVLQNVGSFKSPISFISGENTFNLLKELKPEVLKNFYSSGMSNDKDNEKEPSMTDQLPPKPIPNSSSHVAILTPKSSKLENLSFVSDEIFNNNTFRLEDNRQSSLDIVNFAFQLSDTDISKRTTVSANERSKEHHENGEEEKEKEKDTDKDKDKDKNENKETPNPPAKETPGKPTIELKLPNPDPVTFPIRTSIEGFRTDIVATPHSAISPHPIFTSNNLSIKSDLQSNMNGNVFQSHRFNAYLESLNAIDQGNIISPMSQPLHTNGKTRIKEYHSQLNHPSDQNRFTFPKVIEAYEEENKKIKDMTPMTEEKLQEWLATATPEEIFDNMHKLIGIPKKMNIMTSRSMEVFPKSPNYPVLGMDQYMYKEPKALAPLSAKYKNCNVSIYIKDSDFCCISGNSKISKLSIFPFPLHIVVGVSSCENILNVHIVVQNTSKDYCIKTLSFITASETIAINYTDLLYQNIYFDEQNILRTSFVQIYIDKDNEELRKFVNRWFRVPFELACCNYEIISDINQISISAQVFIFMTNKKDLYKKLEKMNKWEDSMAIVHQTIYGHPLQVIMATLKERLYERWMLDYNDWKRYK